MSQSIAAPAPICDAASLKRHLSGPGSYLEHDGAAWRLRGGPRDCQAESGLVAALERSGALMRLPDGCLIHAAAGARRRLAQTTLTGPGETPASVTVNTAESPLGWMTRRRGGGAAEFPAPLIAAAERLRLDYTYAQIEPRLTMRLDGFVASGARGRSGPVSLEPPESALAAKQRFFAALDAVGPELSGILAEICCLTAGLEQAERSLGFPARAGKAVLQLALTRLARHYGFLAPERAGARHRVIRTWLGDDPRPSV